MNNIMLRDIPDAEKPRERLLKYGVENLSNEELIAICLKTGTNSTSVKTLAGRILGMIEHVSELKDIPVNKFMTVKGIGLVKAIELVASFELGRRVYYDREIDKQTDLCNPENIFEYFRYRIKDNKQEHFYCLYLDSKNNLIEEKLLFKGTLNASLVHPREVFKWAYILSANSIICVHNHPSGDVTPSSQDSKLTEKLKTIGITQEIRILDHVIVGKTNYYSFFEHGKL